VNFARARRSSWGRIFARWGGLALLAVAIAMLAPFLGSGTELVRLRNALSLGADLETLPAWQGADAPADYQQEQVPPDRYFVDIARRIGATAEPDAWKRALLIARHLLGRAPHLLGNPVQKGLRDTYLQIIDSGRGYCGDFVRVFIAIADAAQLRVRPWAFSLDAFGGHGHVWVEVWLPEHQRWQLLDLFSNYYYVAEREEQPLSAGELYRDLRERQVRLELRAIDSDVRPGWVIEAKAWDYLRSGLDGWYLPWGNDVFTVAAALPVRVVRDTNPVLRGVAAWLAGVQPQVRLLATPDNAPQRAAMHRLHFRVLAAGAAAAVALVWLVVGGGSSLLRRLRPHRASAADALGARACRS